MSSRLARALALIDVAEPSEMHGPTSAESAQSAKLPNFADSADFADGGPHIFETPARSSVSASPTPFAPGLLGEWQRGFSRLPFDRAPCPLFRDWPLVCRSIDAFLREHGQHAVEFGWTTLDLFGVHRLVGCIRTDCTGGLVTGSGTPVVSITAEAITYSNGLVFRRRPWPGGDQVVAIWEFEQ